MKKTLPSMSITLTILLLILTTFNSLSAQTRVVLPGTFQSEVSNNSCGDWMPDCYSTELIYKPGTSIWENSFTIPAGCWEYKVALNGTWKENYGEGGVQDGANIQLYVPETTSVTFQYDSVTHVVSSSPYSGTTKAVTKVSLFGSLQSVSGCSFNFDYSCDNPAFGYNPSSDKWEGNFTLPAGCYNYQIKETVGCNATPSFYGDNGLLNGNYISLNVPVENEVKFSYDAATHTINSTPYNGAPVKISLYGTLQSELGCSKDYDTCDNASLIYNDISGKWEATFTLPPGCYSYFVKETVACFDTYYGDGGIQLGSQIQLSIPVESEITLSYDLQTHIMSSTPYSGAPQTVSKVSLYGDVQNELGCANDYDDICDNPALSFNAATGNWEGKFTLPAGCYNYQVKELKGCSSIILYGANGSQNGSIQLYVPAEGEISFSYDPETHILHSTPYDDVSQTVTKVSLFGDLQSETGCATDYDYYCDNPALIFNATSGKWEGKFTLPAGCYQYYIAEAIGCSGYRNFYGGNGEQSGIYIKLYTPAESEISFSYDAQTHIITTTPYVEVPVIVSLYGTLQNELGCSFDNDYDCNTPLLTFNPGSNKWEGTFTLPAGCYQYQVKEITGCNTVILYGEKGIPYGSYNTIYHPASGEISFSYDLETHIITTTASTPVPETITKVSLFGDLQSEVGCPFDFDADCNSSALILNAESGKWEGNFTLPAGCYHYQVKETIGCFNISYYGENGVAGGGYNNLYVASENEIEFSYDPQTHIINTTPAGKPPVTSVSLVGDVQRMLGCPYDWNYWDCNTPAFTFNSSSGLWEGSFRLEPGCYTYVVKKTDGCNNTSFYKNNGNPGAEFDSSNRYRLYLPEATDVVLKFDPVTNLIISDYEDVCPPATVVIPGTFQSELGCQPNSYNGDWEPACDATRLTYDAASKLFIGTFNIPAGSWEYKIAYNNSWAENYGLDGIFYGENIPLELCQPSSVTFKYNYQTHLVALEFNPTAICVTKFYDVNVNGINDDTMPVAGIKFKLSGSRNSVQYQSTGTDGRAIFSGLKAGSYTVTEKLPPNWVATTAAVQSVSLNAPAALSFGNVCLGSGGGHNKLYWINAEGEATLNDDNTMAPELSMLSALNLRNKDGSNYDPADYKELKKWLKNVTANSIYRLSVQLALLQLNVEAGFVNSNAIVYAAGCGNMGYANGFITVNELISKANLALAADGLNLECLNNAIENANNDYGFVQPVACTLNTTVSGRPVMDIDEKAEVSGNAKIWPNPSHSSFTLRPATTVSNEKILLRVFDAAGKLVYTDNGTANKDYHFGNAFKPGLYFVEILQGNNRETFKLVKE